MHYRQKILKNGQPEVEVAFWCFSPAIAMRNLCKEELTSVIITSGTLSPMGTFASELKTGFPVQLENKHVIKPSQVIAVAHEHASKWLLIQKLESVFPELCFCSSGLGRSGSSWTKRTSNGFFLQMQG